MAKIISRGNVIVELDPDEFRDLTKLLSETSPDTIRKFIGNDYDTMNGSLERLYRVLEKVRSERNG